MAELDKHPIPFDSGEDYTIVVYDCNRRRIDQLQLPRGYQLGNSKAWTAIYAWLMSTLIQHNERRCKIALPPNDIEVISG